MISIDMKSLIPDEVLAHMSPTLLDVMVNDIAAAARAKWVSLSTMELRSSQQDYTNAISAVRTGPGVAWVELNGVFPNMIERGFSAYDLRDTLLSPSNPGVKTALDGGRYRSIRFRLGGENVTGRNFRAITDIYAAELGEKRAAAIGRQAKKAIKQLPPGRALAAGHGPVLQKGQLTPHGHPVTHGHKADLFAGAKKGAGGVSTFRTISTNQPDGWMHPGYKPGAGANLAEQVNDYIGRVAPGMFKALLGG